MNYKTMTARKDDQDKPRLDLVPPEFIEGAGRAFGYGVKKYAAYNFLQGEGLMQSRLYGALQRHLNAYWRGEEKDAESGLHHLDHASACLGMLVCTRERKGNDDRAPWCAEKPR